MKEAPELANAHVALRLICVQIKYKLCLNTDVVTLIRESRWFCIPPSVLFCWSLWQEGLCHLHPSGLSGWWLTEAQQLGVPSPAPARGANHPLHSGSGKKSAIKLESTYLQ